MLDDRQSAIVGATHEALRVTDNWIKGLQRGDSLVLADTVVMALRNMVIVCESGSVPVECRELQTAIQRMAEELRQYAQAYDGKVNRDGSPVGSFWGAVRCLEEIVRKVDVPYVEQLESVCELRAQHVSDDQIAFHIYGHRNKGPFVTPNGTVDKRKLDEAAKSQEAQDAILGKGWYPPWKVSASSSRLEQSESRIKAYALLEKGPRRSLDPATIEQMLYDGCYVQQIEKWKDVSRDVVLAEAARLGITPVDAPGWSPKVLQRQAELPVPAEVATPPEPPETSSSEEQNPLASIDPLYNLSNADELTDNIRQAVVACITGNPTFGPAEVVADLAQDFPVTTKHVDKIMKQMKKEETAARRKQTA